MPWNVRDYPASMKNLDPLVRKKAIDIANALLADGYSDDRAIPINNVSTLSQSSMGASNTTTYDNYTPEQRAALAEAAASFKVYGDITSHLVSGSFSNGAIYSTAAGRGGYIEGMISKLLFPMKKTTNWTSLYWQKKNLRCSSHKPLRSSRLLIAYTMLYCHSLRYRSFEPPQ